MLATSPQAVELLIVRSQSLANRRHLPSQAKVRSTTHRLGSKTKPFALFGHLTISRRLIHFIQRGLDIDIELMFGLWSSYVRLTRCLT